MNGIDWKGWDPEGLKRQLMSQLEANGEIAGKFVETEARRRLMAIEDPEWGRAYRQKLVARLLTNVVYRGLNEVVIVVGVRESRSRSGDAGRRHGYYIELGSSTAPAHPFLRPAVFENKRKIVGLIAGK